LGDNVKIAEVSFDKDGFREVQLKLVNRLGARRYTLVVRKTWRCVPIHPGFRERSHRASEARERPFATKPGMRLNLAEPQSVLFHMTAGLWFRQHG